jgi:hypothetical protein
MCPDPLFLGTSSGFAAMANFWQTPYFVTRMTSVSRNAYGIGAGSAAAAVRHPAAPAVAGFRTRCALLGKL